MAFDRLEMERHPYSRRGGQLLWSDIEYAVDYVAHVAGYNSYKPELIVGIARGGLIPAIMLAHRLDVPWVELESLQLRDNPQHPGSPYRPHLNRTEVLFIDDLWDSGETMMHLQDRYPHAILSTLFYKAKAQPPINFPGLRVREDEWLVFPWEQRPPHEEVTHTFHSEGFTATLIGENLKERP